jgi:hypothetical protein
MLIKDATGGSNGSRSSRDEHIGQCAIMLGLDHVIPLWVQKLSPAAIASGGGHGLPPPSQHNSSNSSVMSYYTMGTNTTNGTGFTLTKQQLQQNNIPLLLPIQPPRKYFLFYVNSMISYHCFFHSSNRSIAISERQTQSITL